jgi:hypothetical protein
MDNGFPFISSATCSSSETEMTFCMYNLGTFGLIQMEILQRTALGMLANDFAQVVNSHYQKTAANPECQVNVLMPYYRRPSLRSSGTEVLIARCSGCNLWTSVRPIFHTE